MNKEHQLIQLLKSYSSVAVAFSGGVDSSLLAKACQIALGDKAIAITAVSPLMSKDEIIDAQKVAKQIGIKHHLATIDDLANKDFAINDKMRCYHCHIHRFNILEEFCHQHNYQYLLEGSNADDLSDYRPGMLALKEFAFTKSPFLELHITKQEIRQLAKNWDLPVWNKPSSACLASRLIYGLEITPERLHQIELAENYLKQFVSGQCRVRHHDDLARIEIEVEQFSKLFTSNTYQQIEKYFKSLGFKFVTLDLSGYKKGSNNSILNISPSLLDNR